jgi:hypothetical protein
MTSHFLRFAFLASLVFGSGLRGQESGMAVISLAQALKLGPEGLAAKLGDESEAGLDTAAVYYATAKRMQTEQALGEKDLRLVLDLDLLREAAAEWLDAWYGGMYYVSGGGTMWGHMQSRSQAGLEEALAKLAERMPLKPGNATAETLAKWGNLEKVIAKAKVFEEAEPEMKALWKTQQKVLKEKWQRLYYEFQVIDEPDVQVLLTVLMPSPEELEGMAGK